MSCPHFFYGNCPIIKQENEELITEFLVDLKEIRGLFNIIKNHKSYNGIIEKWKERNHD